MTSIQIALRHQLSSLRDLLEQLDNASYCYVSKWLSEATIGQHVRHVIELVQCLEAGYEAGVVNYDERKRDKKIETDKHYAIEAVNNLLASVNRHDKDIHVNGCYDANKDVLTTVISTYNRELVYNIEHAVHHMALIKVGLKELDIDLINEEFGVGYATVQYRKLCVQ